MVHIFFRRPQPLRVQHADVDDLVLLIFKDEGLSPDPDALGLGVGGGPHGKARFLLEQDGVEEVGLAGPVDPCH